MADRRWWQNAALYQLYVRSWQDSDGDGHGDLRGIIARLDHLAWIGVDGIWLSPTMPSPDQDWGYDVSDYRDVHPDLGTLSDLDALIGEAGTRGIRLLLDLVPNHTSSAHPWFIESSASRDNPRRDYYVWADPVPGGGPPNNWLDATGRPAWQWDGRTGQFYLHNFLAGQPDLNWWEPAVHEEFRQILAFWFDRGVAGFRIDVAQGLYKDALLRDNPPLAGGGPLEGRYGLRHVYNANRPEVHEVYRAWRGIADQYVPPRLLVGETWVGDFRQLATFYGNDDELDLAFNFPFVFADFTAASLAEVVARTMAALPAGACPVWTASNHDVGRFPSYWCDGDDRKVKLALMLLATLPGSMVLYYGDEIGMTEVPVPRERARDAMTADRPDPQSRRDRGRTPMQWDRSANGGFTVADAQPWLPVGDVTARNVADQRQDPCSVLRFCRDLLRLRRAESGGDLAAYEALPAPDGVWRYATGGLVVLANLTDQLVSLSARAGEVLLASAPGWSAGAGELPPWAGVITRRPGA